MPVERNGQIINLKLKNSSLSLSLYGCTILSYTTEDHPVLFLSSKAILDNSKPIRGGIPLVFPQFGPGKLPQHGFARKSMWIEESMTETSDSITATFSLDKKTIPEDQRKLWGYDFSLTFTIILSSTLTTKLKVTNLDKLPFSFTALLHTYLQRNAEDVVQGLSGSYTEFDKKYQHQGDLVLDKEVDRVYTDVGPVTVGKITIERSNTLPNVVVWNPWVEKSKAMADFGNEEYLEMVCVEPGVVVHPVLLEPGSSWEGFQVIKVKI